MTTARRIGILTTDTALIVTSWDGVLAAMTGVRCVAIFSARNALGHWEPVGGHHIVLEERPECAGCMLDECLHEAYKCLTRIEVGAVVRAAVSLIEARRTCIAV